MANRKDLPRVFGAKQDNITALRDGPEPTLQVPQFLTKAVAADTADAQAMKYAEATATRLPELTIADIAAAKASDPTVPRIGELAGNAVAAATDAAAREIEGAAHALMQLAADVDNEAVRTADALRSTGERLRHAINGLTAMANDTLTLMRAERQKVETLSGGTTA